MWMNFKNKYKIQMYDPIYIKFKNQKNGSVVIDIKSVLISWEVVDKKAMGSWKQSVLIWVMVT